MSYKSANTAYRDVHHGRDLCRCFIGILDLISALFFTSSMLASRLSTDWIFFINFFSISYSLTIHHLFSNFLQIFIVPQFSNCLQCLVNTSSCLYLACVILIFYQNIFLILSSSLVWLPSYMNKMQYIHFSNDFISLKHDIYRVKLTNCFSKYQFLNLVFMETQ